MQIARKPYWEIFRDIMDEVGGKALAAELRMDVSAIYKMAERGGRTHQLERGFEVAEACARLGHHELAIELARRTGRVSVAVSGGGDAENDVLGLVRRCVMEHAEAVQAALAGDADREAVEAEISEAIEALVALREAVRRA